MDAIESPAAVPAAVSTPQATGQPSAVVLPFPRRDTTGVPAQRPAAEVGAKPPRGLKPFKFPGLPGVYAHPRGDGSAPLRLRVRDPRRRNAKSGAPVRHNIALGLDQRAPLKDIAARVAEIERKLAQGWNPRGAQLTVREVFYNDVLPRIRQQSRSPKTALSRFQSLIEPYLGDMKIGEITAADVRRWRDRLLAEGGALMPRKPATGNRGHNDLRNIFAVSVELAYRVDNPAAALRPLKESPPTPRALTLEDLARLSGPLAAAPPALQYIVELGSGTAMRIGEILQLQHDDIDLDAGVIRLRHTKAGVPQTVPITPAVARTLQAIQVLRVEGNPYLFPARRGKGPMSPPYKALRKLCADAGVAPAGFHLFRKTAATVAASLPGSDVLTVSRMLRHQSIRTTETHYLATDQQRLRQVAAGLGEAMERRLKGGDA